MHQASPSTTDDGGTLPDEARPGRGAAVALLVLVVSVGMAACSALGTGGDNPFEGAVAEEVLRVTVDNQNFKDATVWARWNGTRVRVGRITGNTSRTYDIRYRTDAVSFEIDFLAGGTHYGREITVSPGDHVRMTIPPNV